MPGFPFRDLPAFLLTPAGYIRYWVLAGTRNGFSERFADKSNGVVQVRLAIDWNDAADFKTYALGSAATVELPGGTAALARRLPLLCPWTNNLYLDDLDAVEAGQFAYDPFTDWWTAEWVVYQATFSSRPFPVKTDAELGTSDPGRELNRYVTRPRRFTARERKVPAWSVVLDQPGPVVPLAEVGFAPFPEQAHVYTWHMVPADHVPNNAIRNCSCKVNDAGFDSAGGGPASAGSFAAETLLFKGLATDIQPYRHSDGEWYCDLSYLFQEVVAPTATWNKAPRADNTWVPVKILGTSSTRPYETADFRTLFQPE